MSDEEKKDVENADQSKAAESETDSSTLSVIEAKMAKIRDKDVEDGSSSDDSKEVDESDLADTEEDVSDEKDADVSDEKDTDASDEKKDDPPMLPRGHLRAALARGYTKEEVDYYLETDPDEAMGRFASIFDEWQETSSRYSAAGRKLREAEEQGSKKEGDKTGSKETAPTLSHYDAQALIEEHGNEGLINALVAPLNKVIDQVNTATERISHSEKFLKNTEQSALATTIQSFLTSKEMKPFNKVYGCEVKNLTDEQVENRMKLFDEADIIAAGAEDHGRDITVQDALERAHIIVSQGTRDEAIRQGIRESMKKRTKTLKGSHEKSPAPGEGQPLSDEEFEKRTEARLRDLRNKK